MGPENNYGTPAPVVYAQPDDPQAKRKRLIIGVGGLLVFVIIVFIVLSLLFSSSSVRPQVVTIAAQTNEIARVAELGVKSEDARLSTQNTAANVRAVSLTNLQQLDDWAGKNLTSDLSKSELSSEENSKTDAALAEAGAINNYQEAFDEAMLALLTGSNKQILASMEDFNDYPNLQSILNEIGLNNQALIDSISSR